MSQLKRPVELRLIEEIFSRTLLPALTYFVIAILVVFWKFRSERFGVELQVGGLFMAALCVARWIIGYQGKNKKINLEKYLPALNVIVVLSGGLWALIFAAVIWEAPVTSLQMFVCFGITNGILGAIPNSLIGNPRIQFYFCVCLGLVPTIFFTYRFLHDGLSFDYLSLSLLLILNFVYVVVLGRKLRAGLLLIFEQQERIQQDLMAAKDIQRSLLPPTNQDFGPAQLEILYRPCEELSGDFFETHVHEGHLLFYIADVTSHGTAAAQVTYLLKAAFRNIIADLGSEIDIAEVTQKICEEYVSYKLNYAISLFTASYNLKDGHLQFVTSNFPNPLLVSENGVEILFSERNPVIDAAHFDPAERFQKSVAVLPHRSRLFAFTDGAYEFRKSKTGREFGFRKFSKLLSDNQAENWTTSVSHELERANGSAVFEDDMTILCLHRYGENA